jgi:hypothetical protein
MTFGDTSQLFNTVVHTVESFLRVYQPQALATFLYTISHPNTTSLS